VFLAPDAIAGELFTTDVGSPLAGMPQSASPPLRGSIRVTTPRKRKFFDRSREAAVSSGLVGSPLAGMPQSASPPLCALFKELTLVWQ